MDDHATLAALMTVAKRLKIARNVAKVAFDIADEEFKDAKYEVLDALTEQGALSTKIDGIGTATITSKTVANTEDWTQVYAYILKNNMPDLLQKRINQTAYKELRDRGVNIPGLVDYKATDLHFRIIND